MFRIKKNLLILLALLMILAFLPACTTVITVACDVADLVTAINTANGDAAHHTLELDPGCTYLLTVVNYADEWIGENGLPNITTPITINGNNATISRASTAPDFRIFYISDTGSLTLNDLTITNGFADSSIGGGIGSAFHGSGGAIYSDGFLITNHTNLLQNTAGFHGGAIFAMGSSNSTYVNDSTISDNSAPLGGGIFIYGGGLLTVDQSNIINNIAITEGGGINVGHGAELIVKDSVISSNHTGRRGGGIFKDGGADREPTTITGTTFEGNTAEWGGGGVFIWRTPLTIRGSQFLGNQAYEYGGGLGYQNNSTETVQITSTTFDGNTAGLDGGGIHFSGELMTIENSAIVNNQAENGGGIHNAEAALAQYIIRADTTMTIVDSKIQENTANVDGGGIFNGGDLTVDTSTVSRNESFTLGGGIHNLGTIAVQDSTFEDNATGFDGGGINTYSEAKVIGTTFVDNSAARGGGLASVGGETTIINSTFSRNTASDTGGGIFNIGPVVGDTSSGGSLYATHITVAYNKAPTGGGIATSSGQAKIKNSIIAYSLSGSDCHTGGGGFSAEGENLDTDGSCPGFTLTKDPLLNPLADNGGLTHTHALQVGSPAIDAAPDCTTVGGATVLDDQRGLSRPSGPFCDLGAYEWNPDDPQDESKGSTCKGIQGVTILDDGQMRTNVNVPGAEGVFNATLNGNPITCQSYDEYPDTLLCDSPKPPGNSQATLIIFDEQGNEFCIQIFSVPAPNIDEPNDCTPPKGGCGLAQDGWYWNEDKCQCKKCPNGQSYNELIGVCK